MSEVKAVYLYKLEDDENNRWRMGSDYENKSCWLFTSKNADLNEKPTFYGDETTISAASQVDLNNTTLSGSRKKTKLDLEKIEGEELCMLLPVYFRLIH